MYVDSQLELSDAQAVTSTAISANVIDLLTTGAAASATAIGPNATINIGIGCPLWLVVQTRTACTDVGSDATLQVTLESDTAVGLASAPVVHLNTGALAFAAFSAAGTRVLVAPLPSGSYKRYLGLRFTVASGPLTAGTFDAFLTTDPSVNTIYKGNFTVA